MVGLILLAVGLWLVALVGLVALCTAARRGDAALASSALLLDPADLERY